MNLPLPGDYIDIHNHNTRTIPGIYAIENLMAHEGITPDDIPEQACTYGIHPWHLDNKSIGLLISRVKYAARLPNLVAIGEAGFDKLRGPSFDLQSRAFTEQVLMSEEIMRPVIIHCVRAWDELLPVHKSLKPKMPWLIHGFRGNVELAMQLLSKGMYISFWFDFVIRPEASNLLRSLPKNRIFLETDGADVDIRAIYAKVAADLNISVEELKSVISANFYNFFKL